MSILSGVHKQLYIQRNWFLFWVASQQDYSWCVQNFNSIKARVYNHKQSSCVQICRVRSVSAPVQRAARCISRNSGLYWSNVRAGHALRWLRCLQRQWIDVPCRLRQCRCIRPQIRRLQFLWGFDILLPQPTKRAALESNPNHWRRFSFNCNVWFPSNILFRYVSTAFRYLSIFSHARFAATHIAVYPPDPDNAVTQVFSFLNCVAFQSHFCFRQMSSFLGTDPTGLILPWIQRAFWCLKTFQVEFRLELRACPGQTNTPLLLTSWEDLLGKLRRKLSKCTKSALAAWKLATATCWLHQYPIAIVW